MIKQFATRISMAIILLAALMVIGLIIANITRVQASAPMPSAKPAAQLSDPVSTPVAPEKVAFEQIAINQQPAEQMLVNDRFVVKRILEINEPFVHGFYKWDDEGVPDGEIVITVDLKAESISVFRDGYEIGAAVITFGDAKKPTPTGVFPITQKNADHISNIYGTPMPYMLRLTNDGIAIHGTEVKWGWGTRGCIGVPTEFARLLFEQVKLGDRVIVTDGKMMQIG